MIKTAPRKKCHIMHEHGVQITFIKVFSSTVYWSRGIRVTFPQFTMVQMQDIKLYILAGRTFCRGAIPLFHFLLLGSMFSAWLSSKHYIISNFYGNKHDLWELHACKSLEVSVFHNLYLQKLASVVSAL